jgi:TRAP transporter TAXI family solute receptor
MKKSQKIVAKCALAVIMILAITGSGNVYAAKQFLSFGTASSAGTWYFLGAGFANIWNKNIPEIRVTAESTAGSEENLHLMMRGKMDIAFTSFSPIVFNIQRGLDVKGKVRLICTGHTSVAHWIVAAASPIKGFEDFKGKRISIGPPGTATIITSENSLEAGFNIALKDFKVLRLRFPEVARGIKDDTIDGGVIQAGVPVASIMELATFKNIRILSMPKEAVEKITNKYIDIAPEVIKGGTYKGVDSDVLTVASPAVIAARSDLSEDIVYKLTKILFEMSKERNAIHPAAEIYTLDNAFNNSIKLGVPFHQGAIKYFKEKGVWKSSTDIQ